jgi:hypothetical protein
MRSPLVAPLKWIWTNTDAITKWITIGALIVGGWWAYHRWFLVDEQTLKANIDVKQNIDCFCPDIVKGACTVKFSLALTNNARYPASVESILIRGWQSPIADLEKQPRPGYVEPGKFQNGELFINHEFKSTQVESRGVLAAIIDRLRGSREPTTDGSSTVNSLLNIRYPPGAVRQQDFVFIIPWIDRNAAQIYFYRTDVKVVSARDDDDKAQVTAPTHWGPNLCKYP